MNKPTEDKSALSPAEKQRLEGLYTASRIFELELYPVQGAFNAAHLKEIHRRIFQDLPGVGFHKIFPGEYRSQGQSGNDWVKTRLLESIQTTSCVAYSRMDQAAQQRLDAALASSQPQRLLGLNRIQLVRALASLYAELDYVHPFGDGNSRTLRVFTRQLAHTVGYSLDWNRFNLSPIKRDLLYIARDKQVNELALPLLHDHQTQQHVQLTLDHFSANPSLVDLLHDAVQPLGSNPSLS